MPESDDAGACDRPRRSSRHQKEAKKMKRQLSIYAQASIVRRGSDALVNLPSGLLGDTYHATPGGTIPPSPPCRKFAKLSSVSYGKGSAGAPAEAASWVAGELTSEAGLALPCEELGPAGREAPSALLPSDPGSSLTLATVQSNTAQEPQETTSSESAGGVPLPGAARTLQWTDSRKLLDLQIRSEQAASATVPSKRDRMTDKGRLRMRLERLNLNMQEMESDGNCQFRAVSQQLYDRQEEHAALRKMAVEHIRSHPEEYKAFLGEDLELYLTTMTQEGTWGDELTLRALTDALGVVVHVVTSQQHNWYLVYEPGKPKSHDEVFLTYIAPIHYNSLRRQPFNLLRNFAQGLSRDSRRSAV